MVLRASRLHTSLCRDVFPEICRPGLVTKNGVWFLYESRTVYVHSVICNVNSHVTVFKMNFHKGMPWVQRKKKLQRARGNKAVVKVWCWCIFETWCRVGARVDGSLRTRVEVSRFRFRFTRFGLTCHDENLPAEQRSHKIREIWRWRGNFPSWITDWWLYDGRLSE